MPPAGTIALSNFLNSASASSSRKRSHAEITRSQSRSVTPDHVPSKRRRINYQPTAESSRDSTPPHPESRARFQGDGLDFRRPVMSTRDPSAATAPALHDVTIDLTADSDSDSDSDNDPLTITPESYLQQTSGEAFSQVAPRPESRTALVHAWGEAAAAQRRRFEQQRELARPRRETAMRGQPTSLRREASTQEQDEARVRNAERMRAPPFGQRSQPLEVIDLSDTDESESDTNDLIADVSIDTSAFVSRSASSFSTSPEVEFVEERRVPHVQHHSGLHRPSRTGLTPPSSHSARTQAGYSDLLRRGTQFIFENMQHLVPTGYAESLHIRRNQGGRLANDDDGPLFVNMDYRRPAFAMGPYDVFDRGSDPPREVSEAYKAPPEAQDGFIRTFGEQDVILCPLCGDELAIGKGDTKKQVWVSKNCGHVYCGDCAVNRFKGRASRRGKGKETEPERKPDSPKSVPFSVCIVDGCNTRVLGKAAMFPIYL
ncbi:hypothetical protein AYL99_02071 [Fonsecaea erecta]|uniref:Uncharacterized protein n=1 Tax=Fonsecaea erecta TaxID=1367422 RepID=A0A178ZSQ8_9EURO|nr:hypothetical protein AYL99_02071 [Fonsecaea erecta]OAP62844.1 hypothetical protein AYL99_02071 [Fonsecaea erecta]